MNRKARGATLLLVGLGVLGCSGGAGALEFPTSSDLPDEPRRPPAVLLDPPTELPGPRPEARASDVVAVLAAPVAPNLAKKVVATFFEAVAAENEELLFQVLDDDAFFVHASSARNLPARGYWLSRMARLDYAAFAGRELYDPEAVETFDREAAHALRDARHLSLEVAAHQMLLRVGLTHAALERPSRFGPVMTFLVGVEDGSARIDALVEDFKLD